MLANAEHDRQDIAAEICERATMDMEAAHKLYGDLVDGYEMEAGKLRAIREPKQIMLAVAGGIWFAARQAAEAQAIRDRNQAERDAAAQREADRDALRVAVDQDLTDFSAPLAGVREVAFFPPMTGG